MGIVVAVLFGPLVWAAHLAVLYGSHASVCAAAGRADASLGPLIPVFALATALALILASLPLAFPKGFSALLFVGKSEVETRFVLSLMRWLSGLSLVAVAANGLAILLVPPC
jgi:hypothetical protein